MAQPTLRVAFATPEFPTEPKCDGGLGRYTERVSRALADRGHDVHVVTLSSGDEVEFDHAGVHVHRVMLGPGWDRLNRVTRQRFPMTCRWLNLSAQVSRRLRQLHRRAPFHVVQYPNYSSCGLFAIPRLRGAAHVVRASSYEPALRVADGLPRTLDSTGVEALQRLQYRMVRHAYAPSETLQGMLAAHVAAEVRVIRPPFYLETTSWDQRVHDEHLAGKRYVLYFGRLQVVKGVHILAQALPRFLERYPDAHAVLIGQDREMPHASSMAAFVRAQCSRFAARLTVIDNLPHHQLYPIIAGARLVVLPSLFDNLPNSCLEAMGLGKPVIGTHGASFDELITNGDNGFLVPPNDPERLSQAMVTAWDHPRLDAIGLAARRRMADFAPDQTVSDLLAYYAEAMRR